jgi:hypothetical protein
MKIPQTIEMQVGALNASEHNPRQITEDDFAELVKSLLLLPKGLYYRPVVVDDRNIALAGNMRLRALKYIHELGFDDLAEILRASYRFRHFDEAKQSALLNYWREWQMHPTVPTLYASELDEDEQQQFIIKDNLSFGTFDIDMLANEYDIAAIIDDGFDIDLLPKSAIEALAAANGIDPNDITGRRCGGDGGSRRALHAQNHVARLRAEERKTGLIDADRQRPNRRTAGKDRGVERIARRKRVPAAGCRTAYGVRLRQDCRLLRTRLERNAGAYGRFGAGHYRLRQSHRKGLHPFVGRNTKRIHTGVWQ